jgi:hypothetical protein
MTPYRIASALILCLVLVAARLDGQSTEAGVPARTAARGEAKIFPVGGIRYGAPLGASLYGGVMLGSENPAGYDGPALVGEVGQDGARVSLGASSVTLAGTYRAQLSLIRTWDDHGDVRSGQLYLGPEIALGLFVGITVGHYWRISDGGGQARLFSIGTVIGV